MLTRLHSVVIDVPDGEAAERDYARMLGRPPVRRERDAETGRTSAFFAVANTALELRTLEEGGRPGQSGIRLACEVGSPETMLAEGGTRVARVSKHRAIDPDGGPDREWVAHLLDPESSRGLPVEIVSEESLALEPSLDVDLGNGNGIDPASCIQALDHLVVMSPAPDDTADFYGTRLGIRLALDKTFDARGVRLLFFRVGGTTIEIGARVGRPPQPEKSDGFGGLAWQVPDVDAIRARLIADGFDVSETRQGNKPGTRVCTVRDPVHSVPTLLIQPVQD